MSNSGANRISLSCARQKAKAKAREERLGTAVGLHLSALPSFIRSLLLNAMIIDKHRQFF